MNLFESYERLNLSIGTETGASDNLMHVHEGMALLILARLITGRSLATPVPFLIVVVFAVANKVMDRINHGIWQWLDTGLDMVNTLFWPLVLMIGLRVRRSREMAPSA